MADKKQTMLYGLLTSIASKITYDNTESGLTATNVQDAVDELVDREVYSTDEKVVGEWIDGRPLYQKTVEITNVQSNKDYDLGLGTDAIVVDNSKTLFDFTTHSFTDYFLSVNDFWENSIWKATPFSGAPYFHIFSGTTTTIPKIILTVNYIKTTD